MFHLCILFTREATYLLFTVATQNEQFFEAENPFPIEAVMPSRLPDIRPLRSP